MSVKFKNLPANNLNNIKIFKVKYKINKIKNFHDDSDEHPNTYDETEKIINIQKINSSFFWSEQGQYGCNCNNSFIPVVFEKGENITWEQNCYYTPIFHNGITITGPTQFKCLNPGLYKISYKIDVYIKNSYQKKKYTDVVLLLTLNGNQINGSTTLNSFPRLGHIYSMSSSVLVKVTKNDIISLLFYSDISKNGNCYIGNPSFLSKLKLPNGHNISETTASLLFIKLSNSDENNL